jgi:hypothetical protein
MNPSGAVFSGNSQPHLNAVSEFRNILRGGDRARLSIDYSRPASVATYQRLQLMQSVTLIGDIAYYYLNYVEELIAHDPQCIFVCIKRDRAETISSWLKKSAIKRWKSLWLADWIKSKLTRIPFYTEYNYWQVHDGSRWKPDPVWDSTFPKFNAASKSEAIGMYWDYYYLQAEKLQQKYPHRFRVFDVRELSNPEGQARLLSFIGIPAHEMICGGEVHLHSSAQ